ncbi:tetratricopeptide repeat protein [Burkholderia sp. JKS000303]|uniref:tetratricopeptide repeat protein n=1 Tax=Burkholderia sp. JKS000303 TaxID=1938747 RepID=UPI000C01858D|nr:hypothetical protein [Burkholderia sp. JKS000303]PFH28553.1 hypothetical protein BX604_2308 [Burkholderia sp. JKS000303]
MVAFAQSNDLLAKRYERQARVALEGGVGNPAFAWLSLGAVAVMQGNHAECDRCVRAAVNLSPRDQVVLANGMALFSAAGEFRRARELSLALEQVVLPTDFTAIGGLVNLHRTVLDFEGALDVIGRFKIRDSDPVVQSMKRLLASAEAHGLTQQMRESLIETAVGTVRAHGGVIRQTMVEDFGDAGLRLELYVSESAERCGELNWAIADALCEQFDDPAPGLVTIACRPASSFQFEGRIVSVAR